MSDYGSRRYRYGVHGQPWYWRRRQNARRQNAGFEGIFKFRPGDQITLGPIIDHDNLLVNMNEMAREGGQAPGPDGIRFRRLGRRERAGICREVSSQIASGGYLPGPASRRDIPKPAGGTRTLSIRNGIDRVISKAVASAITPAIDPHLLDCCMGFRPGRSIQQLLAGVEAAVVQQGLPVIVTDDIRKAFDHVAINDAVATFARHVDDARTMRLIEVILRGHEGQYRQVGIDQGCPLSPLALNVLLDQVLDRPLLAAHPGIPFWRYADNLVWCCQSVSEGHRALHEAHQLLDMAGFALRGDSGPIDLRRHGAHADLLGFRIRRHDAGRLMYELTVESWRNLSQQLIRAHEAPEPAKMANTVVSGWLGAHGPTFGDVDGRAVVDRVLRTAAQMGFWEVGSADTLLRVVGEAYRRWLSIRCKAFPSGSSIYGGHSSSVYGANALRASVCTRAPSGDAEAGLTGSIPAQAGSIS